MTFRLGRVVRPGLVWCLVWYGKGANVPEKERPAMLGGGLSGFAGVRYIGGEDFLQIVLIWATLSRRILRKCRW